jgi:copper chaperone
LETIELSVPTVHCQSCKLTIEDVLDELPGVADADVDVDAKRVSVTYEPEAVDRLAIRAAVEDAGYPIAT